MSKKKARSPQEKKTLSYAKDRRNTYGENDKASRKAIPLRKAMENRQDRRKVAQEVAALPNLEESAADLLESSVRHDVHRVGGWRKAPDQPLGKVVAWSSEARARRAGRQTKAQPQRAEAESPGALRRLANRYRRWARRLARNLRIGRKAGVPGELEQLWLEKAEALEVRADEVIRERAGNGG